jgi:Xaa-Pro dipeptidase
VEDRFLKVVQQRELQRALEGADLRDISGVVEDLAAVPSSAETEAIQHAARVTEIGHRTGLVAVQEGSRAYQAVGAIHDAMYRAGQTDFDRALVAVWSGPDGGHMHDTVVTQQFVRGDVATVEVMGVHDHYRVCSQSSISVGPPSPDTVAAHALVVEMHEAARSAIRAGVTAGEIFRSASEVYRSRTGQDYFRRVGGSIGLTNFALDLTRDNGAEVVAGTPLVIQTLVIDPVMVCFASTVQVTEDGFRVLTEPVLDLTIAS